MVRLESVRSWSVQARVAKGDLSRTSSSEPSLSDRIIVPDSTPLELRDRTGTPSMKFRDGESGSHLSLQDEAAIVSVALPYTWSFMVLSFAQSTGSS